MNRRMRNRMYGGVGGRRAQARPLPDPKGRGAQRLSYLKLDGLKY
jgi:hypothetical protein